MVFPFLSILQGFETLLNDDTNVNEKEETNTDTETDDKPTKGNCVLQLALSQLTNYCYIFSRVIAFSIRLYFQEEEQHWNKKR